MGTHHAVRSLHLRHKLPLSTSTPTDTVLVVATQSLRSTCTPRRSHWPSWPLLACRRRATRTRRCPGSKDWSRQTTARNQPRYYRLLAYHLASWPCFASWDDGSWETRSRSRSCCSTLLLFAESARSRCC